MDYDSGTCALRSNDLDSHRKAGEQLDKNFCKEVKILNRLNGRAQNVESTIDTLADKLPQLIF